MDRLPIELLRNVLQELDPSSLKEMRLVNKQCAALATPILFAVIQFFGPGQQVALFQEARSYPKRSVEFGALHEAVSEVLPIAGDATKLVFAPAFYREGFWDDYRTYLNQQMEEPVDEVDLYSSGGEEDQDEDEDEDKSQSENEEDRYEARVQAVIARRRARPDAEREMIREYEEHWHRKREEQEANREKIEASLQELIERTRFLKEIEIQDWEFSGFGDLTFDSYEIDAFRDDSSPTVHYLHMIARCLHRTGHHIERLHIHALNPELIQDTPAMRFMFEGLRYLELDTYNVDSLLEDSSFDLVLPRLLEYAKPTLERVELVSGNKWPQLPSRGVHLLSKIFNDKGTDTPISFPKLRSFRLVCLIVSTTSLLEFLGAQPNINSLEFSYVYLATPDMGWKSLATALPASVETWDVTGRLGQGPIAGFPPPISYNWCADWNYRFDPLPITTGWEDEPVDPARTRFQRISESDHDDQDSSP